AEEGAEAEQLGLEPRAALSRPLLHRVTHPLVEVAHELVEHGLLRVEVEVEGALRDARRLGDLDHRRLVVAELAEHLLGGVEQPAPRIQPAPRERPAGGVRQHVGHAVTACRSSLLTTLPSELRGSSPTSWTLFGTLKRP